MEENTFMGLNVCTHLLFLSLLLTFFIGNLFEFIPSIQIQIPATILRDSFFFVFFFFLSQHNLVSESLRPQKSFIFKFEKKEEKKKKINKTKTNRHQSVNDILRLFRLRCALKSRQTP